MVEFKLVLVKFHNVIDAYTSNNNPYSYSAEYYKFLSNTKVELTMESVRKNKSYTDTCSGQYTIEGNEIKVSCICEDKSIYQTPLKETFIYDKKSNTLTSTILVLCNINGSFSK